MWMKTMRLAPNFDLGFFFGGQSRAPRRSPLVLAIRKDFGFQMLGQRKRSFTCILDCPAIAANAVMVLRLLLRPTPHIAARDIAARHRCLPGQMQFLTALRLGVDR